MRFRLSWVLLVVVVATISSCSGGTSVRTGAAGGGSTTTTVACPPNPPPPPPSGETTVTTEPCGSASLAKDRAQMAQQWPVSCQPCLSRDQAIADARSFSGASTGTAHAKLMNYQAAAQVVGEAPTAIVDPNTQVWVVTIFARPNDFIAGSQPGGPNPNASASPPTNFTLIMDGSNGSVIDTCSPCAGRLTSG